MTIVLLDPGPLPDPGDTSGICYITAGDFWLNAFDKLCPWNMPIGTGVEFATTGVEVTAWNSQRGCNVNPTPGAGWGCQTYKNDGTEPLQSLSWDGVGGGNNQFPPSNVLRFPDNLNTGTAGNDQNAYIFDTATSMYYEFWRLRKISDRNWKCASVHSRPGNGLGYNAGAPNYRGVPAAGLSIIKSLIWSRQWDGDNICQNCLGIALDRNVLGTGIVFPGTSTDGSAAGTGVSYGRRLAIPTPDKGGPDPLGTTGSLLRKGYEWATGYGLYVIDQSTGNSMRAANDVSNTLRTNFISMMNTLWPHFKPVMNFTASQTVCGGGTPIVPNCAYNSGAPRG